MIQSKYPVRSGSDAVFPKAEYDKRCAKLKRAMNKAGHDLYLTSSPENIFYLTGQQTPGYYTFQCLAVPTKGVPFLMLRGLEELNARANTYLDDIVGYPDNADPAEAAAGILVKRGFKGKGIAVDQNSWFLTVNLYNRLKAKLGKLQDGSGIVEVLRRVKSPVELAALGRAAKANDEGMRAGIAAARSGTRENEVAAAVMHGCIAAGSEYVGMQPLLVAGPRSGIPHATWRRRKIRPRDLLIMESASAFNRYHATLYRTIAVGDVPKKAREMYKVCQEGLAVARKQLKPGNRCADVHNAAQAVIDEAGYTDGFRKRCGYSIGISFAPDWGEGNILSLFHDVQTKIEPGMAFHLPISLRIYGKWTVAVSESVIVTDKGHRRLSKIPQDLIEVA